MTVKELYDRIGGNYEEVIGRLSSERLVTKFVIKFLDDKTVPELKDAVEKGDREMIFRAAHTLKGVAANLAFSEILKQAEIITEATRNVPGKEPDEKTDINAAFATLYAAYEKTVTAIKEFAAEQ